MARGLLAVAVVKNTRHFSAVLCHRRTVRCVAIAVVLAACGGAVEAPDIADRTVADASSPPTGCPSDSDIDTGATVGRACAPEETYCANSACDPCTKTCPAVRCTRGVWTPAVNTAHCTPTEDASTGRDAAVCMVLDPSTFDQTCTIDPDCFAITAGTFCSGAPWCMCPFTAINVDGQSRYQQELQDIQARLTPGPRGCSCPFFGRPTCVGKHCVLCGGASNTPGCPDAG